MTVHVHKIQHMYMCILNLHYYADKLIVTGMIETVTESAIATTLRI